MAVARYRTLSSRNTRWRTYFNPKRYPDKTKSYTSVLYPKTSQTGNQSFIGGIESRFGLPFGLVGDFCTPLAKICFFHFMRRFYCCGWQCEKRILARCATGRDAKRHFRLTFYAFWQHFQHKIITFHHSPFRGAIRVYFIILEHPRREKKNLFELKRANNGRRVALLAQDLYLEYEQDNKIREAIILII